MKVLYLIDTLGHGGSERQLLELLKGIDHRDDLGYGLCLLSDRIDYREAHALRGRVWILSRRPGFDWRIFGRLSAISREYKPDIIHAWDVLSSLYVTSIAKSSGIILVSSIRNAPNKLRMFSRWWFRTRLAYPFADHIIANSRAGLLAYDIAEQKGRYIHNGFDFERLRNLEPANIVRQRHSIQTKALVGMVGRFHPHKDNETFLRAAIQVCSRRKDVTFVAVGDGRKLERCKRMIPPELSERITFLGVRLDVESLVNSFDVAVLATHAEGISNAILEYMALAKPVVATSAGGTSELVLDNVTGFLVRPSDPHVMARKIEFLLENPGKAQEMGIAGKKRIEQEFNIPKMTESYVEAYRSYLRS